jgi:hypothetical protein
MEANFTLTIKMLYNSCTGIYKFGNNTYLRRIRRRSHLGHIFQGKKMRLMGQEILYLYEGKSLNNRNFILKCMEKYAE